MQFDTTPSTEERILGSYPSKESLDFQPQLPSSDRDQDGQPIERITGSIVHPSSSKDDVALHPAEQSRRDRERNLQEAIDLVKPKLENDPSHVSAEDANLLHSRECRAHGRAEKNGLAALAQRLAARNARDADVEASQQGMECMQVESKTDTGEQRERDKPIN